MSHSTIYMRFLLHILSFLGLLTSCSTFVQGGRSSIVTPPANVVETPALQCDLRTRTSSNLNNSQVFFHASWMGAALPQAIRADGLLQVNIMLPHKDDDITGCSGPWRTMNEFNQTYEQSFILLMVGACSSINTYSVAGTSGALGVILYGCPPEKPYNCDPRMPNAFSLVPVASPLPPVIAITNADGRSLVNFLKGNLNATTPPPQDALQMLIKSSGPLVPEERAALIAIANQTTMGNFVGGPSLSLPPWSVARFQDASLDPCLNRTMGLWCELGHLVSIDVYYYSWTTFNSIPTEFSAFPQLKYFSNYVNLFHGPIPTAWCSLTQLVMFRIENQIGGGITSLPECIGSSWTHLRLLQLDGNSLTTLPNSLSQLTSLEVLRMANNFIQSVPSLVNLTQLLAVDFSSNAISAIPTFSPFAINMFQIGFGSNQITAPIPPNAFDGMTALQVIDLNTNHITGPLPNLIGCSSLQIVDFSSQRDLITNTGGFNGSMPSSWTSLLTLKELYLQENALTSPVYSAGLLSLERIDLSHNYLTNAIPSNLANTNPVGFLDSVFAPSMISLKLSYNLLSGSFIGSPGVLLSNTLSELYLDHNQLTTMITTIFRATSPFTAIDFSFNNISLDADGFLSGEPAPRMVYLNFRGNTYLRMTDLPSWVVVGSTLTQELGQQFGCADFTATTAPLLSFLVDPGFWSYQHCQCAQGTFGRPPLCHSVPNAAILQPDHVITSSEIGDDFSEIVASVRGVGSELTVPSTGNYSRAFSDSMYGENRLTLGMSTVWVIDVTSQYADDADAYVMAGLAAPEPIETYRINTTIQTPSSLWTPVRMITVRLHVSATQFTAFEDVISVYEGPSDLKGNRVSTMRGTDTKSLVRSTVYTTSPEYLLEHNASISQISDPRLYEIQVFSPMASVQFTSRAINGLHFYATYSYDFTCPDGYFYNRDVTPNQCHLNYEEYHVGLPIRSAVFAVSSLTIVFILINIVILALFWNSPVYKAASRIFMAVILVLLLFMGLGSLLYASVPNVNDVGSAICIGRGWLTCLPLTGILGVLLAKTNRLNAIFGATTLQVKKMTDMDIGKTVLLVCSVQIILLGIYSGLPLSRAQLAVGKGNLDDRLILSCSQESGFMIWTGIEIAYIACLMLPAAYLGYKTRNLPSQYNESSHIQNAIVLLIFFGIIIVPLDIFIQDDPEAAILIQGLGQAFMCLMMSAIIFGPKLYHLSQTVSRGAVGGDAAKTQLGTNTVMSTSDELTIAQQPAHTLTPLKHSRKRSGSLHPSQQQHQTQQQQGGTQTLPPHRPSSSLVVVPGSTHRTDRSSVTSSSSKPLPLAVNPGLNPTGATPTTPPPMVNQVGGVNGTGGGSHRQVKRLSFSASSSSPTQTTITTGTGTSGGASSHPSSFLRTSPQIELVSSGGTTNTAATTPTAAAITTTNNNNTIPTTSSSNDHGPVEEDGVHLIISNRHDVTPSLPGVDPIESTDSTTTQPMNSAIISSPSL